MVDRSARYTRMDEATAEDFAIVAEREEPYRAAMADRMLELFRASDAIQAGTRVSNYVHGLQTATRALRDGADEEMVVVALLHDVGEGLCVDNHSAVGAELLRPYVSEGNYWLVRHHGLFQGYYYLHFMGQDRNARDRHRGHPMYQATVDFCARWDQCSFDPGYDTLPLATFEPMVRRVFARKPPEMF
jgi:predicted HD phosphohydrolase